MRVVALALCLLTACGRLGCELTNNATSSCKQKYATQVDTEIAEVGDSCQSASCAAGAYCDMDTNVCKKARPDGAACKQSMECLGKCNSDNRCE